MNNPKWLIVHHTSGTAEDPKADTSNQTVSIINEWHKEQYNFKSSLGSYVGYQYVIEKDGETTKCRLDTEMGAHTNQVLNGVSMNSQSIGICLVGNFDVTLPTKAQEVALKDLLTKKMKEWSIPLGNIIPHRHFATFKSCYGDKLASDWAQRLVESDILKPLPINTKSMNATKYEIVDKETRVATTVVGWAESVGGELPATERVTVVTGIGNVVFENPNQEGKLTNERYVIREIGTHLAPNGVDIVEL